MGGLLSNIFVSVYPFGEYDTSPLEILNTTNSEVTYNPYKRKLKPEELRDLALSADCVIAGTEDMNPLIDSSINLRFISRVGIGLDSVPLYKCKQKGIRVSYTPDAVTMAVAELTVGLMVTITRHVLVTDKNLRQNQWTRLTGKRIGKSVIGIIGLGRVGINVVKLLSNFQPKEILVNDIKNKIDIISDFQKDFKLNIKSASKEDIFQQADIVSLHIPLTSKTRNLINSHTLKLFQKNTFLLNTSRGSIIKEGDLHDALLKKSIAGAALDVFEEEPYNGKLAKLKNVILTPHIGSCSFDCRKNMELGAAQEVLRFINGEKLQSEVPQEEYGYQEIYHD
ncbi:MAG: phosphoglycerate dehydrogenase [Leptospiraceae bacterium]|nr:phosphoglycerate dehydrogenase [Leptospiraceae bacterium]MCP5495787.1 phosphoglycerate dehydrogenase [Leptospiraceae bacterium]